MYLTGLYLIVWARPRGNYLDNFSLIEIMTGVIAASPEESQKILMLGKVNTLVTADNEFRILEMKGMNSLPKHLKSNLMMTLMIVLSELEYEKHKAMMKSIDKVNKQLQK